jgi:hypothetical protein
MKCFCWDHTGECKSSQSFNASILESNLKQRGILSTDEWTVVDVNGKVSNFGFDDENSGGLFVPKTDKEIWFNAPSKTF